MTVEVSDLKIGEKISRFRQSAGISVDELAVKISVTPAVMQQIERDVVQPTIAALLKISKYFKIDMSNFFEAEKPKKIEVLRKEERRKVKRDRGTKDNPLSYSYEALASPSNKHMLPYLVEFDVGVEEEVEPLSHEGEEFLYVLEGELDIHVDNEVIRLHPGDSLYFDSSMPHSLQGSGKINPRAIAVVYPEKK